MTLTQKRIACLDLKKQHQAIKQEIFEAFEKVYEATAFSGGPFVEAFEKQYAKFCGTDHAIAVNNGTSALHLAMLALGIGPGDEVIIPANTFIATAWGVSYTGATPVFVDCTNDTWQIDPTKIEEKITSRTKAIAGVHLYGQPFDYDEVERIARKHDLSLIEDAAQAQGATYKNRTVGSLAEMACFSFYPGKNLGACGEAGCIVTSNEAYEKHLRSLRNHGSTVRYSHDELGFNMRMGGLEAASLGVKLEHLPSWNEGRRKVAERYFSEVKNPKIQMQNQPVWADSVFHLFVVTVPDREDFIKYLNDKSIFPGLHYPVPCHLQKAYSHLGFKTGDYPNSEHLASHCVSLPMYAELTEQEVNFVIEALNNY